MMNPPFIPRKFLGKEEPGETASQKTRRIALALTKMHNEIESLEDERIKQQSLISKAEADMSKYIKSLPTEISAINQKVNEIWDESIIREEQKSNEIWERKRIWFENLPKNPTKDDYSQAVKGNKKTTGNKRPFKPRWSDKNYRPNNRFFNRQDQNVPTRKTQPLYPPKTPLPDTSQNTSDQDKAQPTQIPTINHIPPVPFAQPPLYNPHNVPFLGYPPYAPHQLWTPMSQPPFQPPFQHPM